MSNEYTLHYFDLYGRGETIRMLLSHAGVKFEDHRIQFNEWPGLKPTMPNQQVPCLELPDGKKMGQTRSILRFVGMKHGYYPTDPLLACQADSLCDGYEDIMGSIYKPHFMQPGAEKDALIKDIFEKTLPKYCKIMEEQCSKGHKFILGDKLTTADFFIGMFYTSFVTNPNITFA